MTSVNSRRTFLVTFAGSILAVPLVAGGATGGEVLPDQFPRAYSW